MKAKNWHDISFCSQVSQRRRTRHTRQAAAILGTLVSDCPTRQVTTLALTTLTTIMRPTSRPWTWTWTLYRRSLHLTIIHPPPHRSFTILIWTSTTPCLCELTNYLSITTRLELCAHINPPLLHQLTVLSLSLLVAAFVVVLTRIKRGC